MKKNIIKTYKISNNNRSGMKDIWNAYMVQKAHFSKNDIPLCPTTATSPPSGLISFEKAKIIHNKMIISGNFNYKIHKFIHFFIDDYKFDDNNLNNVWLYPDKVIEILNHFDGMINVDFSTYADFPDPLKRWNYYRMNAFGYWISSQGYNVISCVRWDAPPSWEYCFDGNPQNSMVSIGTVASSLKYKVNHTLFKQGLFEMVKRLNPHTIIVYGSSNYSCFDKLREKGINIITFDSETNLAYKRGDDNE